jgi:hypothetical protein
MKVISKISNDEWNKYSKSLSWETNWLWCHQWHCSATCQRFWLCGNSVWQRAHEHQCYFWLQSHQTQVCFLEGRQFPTLSTGDFLTRNKGGKNIVYNGLQLQWGKTFITREVKSKSWSCPCNGLWWPVRLWDVEAPTFSRQSAHRWQWGCQRYAPTSHTLSPRIFLVAISVRGRVDLSAVV